MRSLILGVFTILFSFAFLAMVPVENAWAFPGSPPIARTGAPTPTGTEATCNACHGPVGVINATTSRIEIAAPSRYCPNTSHSISVTMQDPQSAVNGFQIVAKNASNNISGTLTSAIAGAQVSSNYGMQNNAGTALTSWSFNWQSPAAGAGLVTFYGAGNATDGDGQCRSCCGDTDDRISTTSTPLPENTVPGVPPLSAPFHNEELAIQTVSLEVTEATDIDAGEAILHQFQLCDDALCSGGGETDSPGITAVAGVATWSPGVLADNQQYWWRARASDGCSAFGNYSAIRAFTVNVAAESPSAPALTAPAFDEIVPSATPTITVTNAPDADPADVLTYAFEVATDAGFVTVVADVTGVAQGSGATSWQVTPALAAAMRYYVRVIATDSTANASPATTTTFIYNNKPLASNLSLTPATADTTHSLTGGYLYSDADADGENGTRIRWFQNGLPVSALDDETFVDASMTSLGDVWYFTVTPRDGVHDGDEQTSPSVTILDARPSISAVDLTPLVAFTDTDITCTPSGWSDADGDLPDYDYVWTQGGSPITGASSSVLTNTNFVRGDSIACEATPKGSANFGATVTSATLVISNRLPVLSAVGISPGVPGDAEAMYVAYTFADLDADGEGLREIRWYRDTLPVGAFDDVTTVTSGFTAQGEAWYVEIRISDGFGYSALVTSSTVVVNSRPVASNVTLTPASPDTSDNLVSGYDYFDAEGHLEDQTEIRWFKNGVHAAAFDGLAQIDAADTTRGEAWWVTITPHDGLAYGLPVSSAMVTVRNSVPSLTAASLLPAVARTDDTLTCTPSGWADADGDAEGTQFTWLLDGSPIAFATDATLSGATFFARGNDIACEATPYDGLAAGGTVTSSTVTIQNTAPVATNPLAGPETVDMDTDLVVSSDYSDADGDAEGAAEIRWFQNGLVQIAFNDLDTIAAADTLQGDVWYFEIRAYDGADYSAVATSPTVTVNTLPVATNVVVSPAAPTTATDLTVAFTYADADSDPQGAPKIRWYKNAVAQGLLDDLTLVPHANTERGEVWHAVVRPYDGLSYGEPVSAPGVTILNTAPYVASVNLQPVTVATNDSVTCVASGWSDGDGDTENYQYSWRRNGTAITGVTTPSLNGATAFAKGDQIYCWATPFDGLDFGSPVSSPVVTVLNTAPTVSNVVLAPAAPTTAIDLSVTYSFGDVDSDTDTASEIRWYRDGAEQAGLYGSLTVGAAATAKDEVWTVSIRPHDGSQLGAAVTSASVTIQNSPPPGAPSVNAPATGSRYSAATLALSVNNAFDPDDDTLTYEFELFGDAILSQRLQHWIGVAAGPTTAAVAVTATTTENAFYYWRARAHDPLTAGPWMTAANFQLNQLDEAPLTPSLLAPADLSEVGTLSPTVAVNPGVDPDGDSPLTYRFQLCLDSSCLAEVYDASVTVPSYTHSASLSDNTTYYWTVAVSDGTLLGAWMDMASFRVNLLNDAPGTPAFTGLAAGQEVTTTTLIVAALSSDLDLDPLTYYVEADTAATFDTPAFISASGAGAGVTLATLLDNTAYFLRVQASDGTLTGQWHMISIFVNVANDAPETPVLNNPSDGSAVASLRPVFSMYTTTDLDGDALRYEFEVYTNPELTNRAAYSPPLTSSTNLVSWTPDADLNANATLYWRVRSVDEHGLPGAWSAANTVQTSGRNDAPSAPGAVTPIGGVAVQDATPELRISAASDADGDTLAYRFEIFADSRMTQLIEDSADLASTAAEITFTMTETLEPGAWVYWRAAAFDGIARSPWTDTQQFQMAAEKEKPVDEVEAPVEEVVLRKVTVEKSGGGCATAADDPTGMWLAAALTVLFWVLRKRQRVMQAIPVAAFFVFAIAMPATLSARSGGPETGKAGDPTSTSQTNPTCSQCHGDGFHNHGNSLVLSVPPRYIPGAKYNVTIEMLGKQSNTNGFQMIPKRLSGSSYVLAGSMADLDPTKTQVVSGYAMHTASGNAVTLWTVEWTAPPAGSGSVTFYAAGNASDGDGDNDIDDRITTANATSIESVAPTVASVNAPAGNTIVMAVPTLSVNIATDANGDALTYSFELCATPSCATFLEAVSGVTAGGATVSWLPTITLVENTRYWWRAWANDGTSNGPKFAPVSFWFDAVPEAPGSPTIFDPADGTSITTRFPLITVSNAVDPDPTDAGLLTYDFVIATDSGFTTVITSITNVPEGAGETTWQIGSPSPLENLETYYLLVTVRDLTNQTATSTASFSLDLTNALPTAPTNLLPGGSIVTPAPTFQADASTDLDGDTLTYFFALDTTTAFNSPAKRLADALATPAWTPGLPALIENQRYFWRVRAFDGKSFGPFASQTIFINAVNDAPAAPLSFAPLDGALVNDRMPALRIHAAADPDEDALTYIYEVARDAAFLEIVERSQAIAPAADDTVTWQPATLENEAAYFWRAHAVDPFGLAGPDGAPFSFTLVNANLPPGAPTLPSNVEFSIGEDAFWPEIRFKATAPGDPDGDAIFLFYELYADSKLLVPVTSSTATLPGVAWEPDVKWTAGTYYVRVRAEDPFLTGPWSNTAKVTLSGPPPFAERELSATLRTEVTPGGCASRGGASWAWVLLLLPLLRIRRSALVLLLFTAACGAPEEATTTISRPTSFAEVQGIFNTNCISCHSGDDPAGKLNLLSETNGTELIGVKPTNPVALDRGYLRVTQGEPETSFILYKLTEPSLGEGERMPYRQPKLSADDVEVIRRWIANGALTE